MPKEFIGDLTEFSKTTAFGKTVLRQSWASNVDEGTYVQTNSDGTVTTFFDGESNYAFDSWPTKADVAERGNLAAIPMPKQLVVWVGRVIIQAADVETRIKQQLELLCKFNGSSDDWRRAGKFGKIISFFQAEAKKIETQAPTAVDALVTATERYRQLYQWRNALAHGEITLMLADGHMMIRSFGKHGPISFTETALRDLALRICKISYVLTYALDSSMHLSVRTSQEIEFLQALQASNVDSAVAQP